MQKPCFSRKVEVLPAHQSNTPGDAKLRGDVDVAGGGADANVGAELLNVLCAQTVCFCYCMLTMLAYVFFGIRSKASFRMHFTNGPRAALLVAGRAPVVGPPQNAGSVLTICILC